MFPRVIKYQPFLLVAQGSCGYLLFRLVYKKILHKSIYSGIIYGVKDILTQRSRGSSHYIFSHHALPYSLSVPKERPIKATYVRDVLKMVDDIVDTLGKD